MSFFNKIQKNDSLDKAISRKKGQSSISDKTRRKLQDKVNRTRDSSAYDTYMLSCDKSSGINEEILMCLRKAFLLKAYPKVISCLEKNISPGESMNFTDEILMESIIKNLKKKAKYSGLNLSYYRNISSFYEFLSDAKEGTGRGVIKMAGKGHLENAHFCALEYRIIKGRKYVLFMESARLQGTSEAGPDYGVMKLQEMAKQYFKENLPVIAYFEMDVQRSAYDCAIYSLYTATHLHYCNNFTNGIFNEMQNVSVQLYSNGRINITCLYWKRAERILHAGSKYPVTIPIVLLKHAQSVKKMREVVDFLTSNITGAGHSNPVNSKFNVDKLKARAEKFYVERESALQKGKMLPISNSIEYKRKKLYEALLSEAL